MKIVKVNQKKVTNYKAQKLSKEIKIEGLEDKRENLSMVMVEKNEYQETTVIINEGSKKLLPNFDFKKILDFLSYLFLKLLLIV